MDSKYSKIIEEPETLHLNLDLSSDLVFSANDYILTSVLRTEKTERGKRFISSD